MDAGTRFERVRLLYACQRFERCAEEVRLFLSVEPDNSYGHSVYGLCLSQLGHFAEAAKETQQGIHLAPESAEAHFVHGRVLAEQSLYDRAEAAIQEAIRLNADNADYWGYLAIVRSGRREWQGAREAADRGLSLEPDHVQCLQNRSTAQLHLDDPSRAEATARRALALQPENAWSHVVLARTLDVLYDGRLARDHYRIALRLNPRLTCAVDGLKRARHRRQLFYARIYSRVERLKYLPNCFGASGIVLGWFGIHLIPRLVHAYPAGRIWGIVALLLYFLVALIVLIGDSLLSRIGLAEPVSLATQQREGRRPWIPFEFACLASLGMLPLSLYWPSGRVLSYIADALVLLTLFIAEDALGRQRFTWNGRYMALMACLMGLLVVMRG